MIATFSSKGKMVETMKCFISLKIEWAKKGGICAYFYQAGQLKLHGSTQDGSLYRVAMKGYERPLKSGYQPFGTVSTVFAVAKKNLNI